MPCASRRQFALPWLWLLVAMGIGVMPSPLPVAARERQADDFLLRASGRAAADGVASRHRLRIVGEVIAGELYRVVSDDDRSDDQVEADVEADSQSGGLEPNRRLEIAEIRPEVSLQQSTAAILETLPSRTLVSFFGQQVWSRYVQQPATRLINLTEAQAITTGGGIVVAVIDTGIDPGHPLLREVLVPGYDFTRDRAGLPSELADLDQSTAAILEQSTAAILERDAVVSLSQSTAAILEGEVARQLSGRPLPRAFGHGTMVAGLVRLVAPGARIMPLKAFDADGNASLADLVRAVHFAADQGASVINLSFTMPESSDELKRAIDYARGRGVLAVASAGNDGRKVQLFPARDVIGVGSTGDLDQRSPFSNYGSSARIAAPGEGVVTTYPAGLFAAGWGTSFSTGLAAGAAALAMAALPAGPSVEQREGRERLAREALRRAVPIGQDLGSGRLDAQLAVEYVRAFATGGSLLLPDADDDGDGMSNAYEAEYALDPRSSGDRDLDADRDGVSNLREFVAGSHPRGVHQAYLAEGAVSALFDVGLALFNPGAATARVQLRFQCATGPEVVRNLIVGGGRRATVSARDIPELGGREFSTSIDSDEVVVVDRTMSWDPSGYGSHAERAITAPPGLEWFLAEGATTGDFQLFYLLQNPGPTAAEVEMTFLRPAPLGPVVERTSVPPLARQTVWVNTIAGLEDAEVSGVVRSRNQVPILVERAMYLSTRTQPFAAGHGGAATAAPALDWFLAEGATGPYFDTFVLVGNPGEAAADLEVAYLLPDGDTVSRRHRVAGRSRLTIWVDTEHPRLADTAVSTRVTSRNGVPVIVERAMWWPQGRWQESHVTLGATETGRVWALAEGEEGGARRTQTYVLLANPSAMPGTARVTLYFEDGETLSREFPLLPSSRFNVAVGSAFPEARGRRFATLVESLGPSPVPLVVERSMYTDAAGVAWTAGTNALGTRLR